MSISVDVYDFAQRRHQNGNTDVWTYEFDYYNPDIFSDDRLIKGEAFSILEGNWSRFGV